jgi:carbamoyltransferase
MAINLRARSDAYSDIPGVIHEDGTARVQVVRKHDNPLAHAYLEALGVRIGCEVSVNTSLNVHSPIPATADQALETFVRAPQLDALVLVASDGTATLVTHAEPTSRREDACDARP